MTRSQFYEMQDRAEVTCVVCVYVWCVYVCVCVFSGRVCDVCAHVGCVYMVCVCGMCRVWVCMCRVRMARMQGEGAVYAVCV